MVDGKWHKDKQQIKHKQKDCKKTAGGKKGQRTDILMTNYLQWKYDLY